MKKSQQLIKERKKQMTKKQSLKKKISIKLIPGQAVFVADIDIMNHIISVYYDMAESCTNNEESQAWSDVAIQIQQWCNDTYYSGEGEFGYEEEW